MRRDTSFEKLMNVPCDGFADVVVYNDKEELVYTTRNAVCFAQFGYTPTVTHILANQFVGFRFKDELSPLLNKQSVLQEFLDDLYEIGILDDQCSLVIGEHEVIIRWNIDITSSREMFFVGNFVRTIDYWPAVVYDYLRLKSLYKSIDKWKLLYCAFGIWLGSYRRYSNQNHSAIDQRNFLYLKKNPKEVLDEIRQDTWGVFRKNVHRNKKLSGDNPVLGWGMQETYIKLSAINNTAMNKVYIFRKETPKINKKYRDLCLNSMLSEDGFNELLRSNLFINYEVPRGVW